MSVEATIDTGAAPLTDVSDRARPPAAQP
jgi:hypothetical protein